MSKQIISFLLFLFLFSTISFSQEKIAVPLKLDLDCPSSFFFGIDFREKNTDPWPIEIAKPGEIKLGRAKGNLLVSARREEDLLGGYYLKVDTNQDEKLDDEKEYYFQPDSKIQVSVKRTFNNHKKILLPYTIWFSRTMRGDTISFESFRLISNYCSNGEIIVGDKKYKIRVKDTDANGRFDKNDFLQGSTISIDMNNDGEFRYTKEYYRGSEVIKIGNQNFLVDSLEEDGSAITFVKTDLPFLAIGSMMPGIKLTTTEGRVINTSELKGKPYLLDFWATWCGWCIVGFDSIKVYHNNYKDLQIISICTDEPTRIDKAKKILNEKNLLWQHVVFEKGQEETLWRMFGSVAYNQMAVPLYIVVDINGVIKYAGTGGNPFLARLKEKIEEVVSNKND